MGPGCGRAGSMLHPGEWVVEGVVGIPVRSWEATWQPSLEDGAGPVIRPRR